ncbi:unnamed protein product [Gordionus sp. m RMFG-2023]
MGYFVNPTSPSSLICKCIIYSSLFKSEGIFTSPNYPSAYHLDSNHYLCLIYFFLGTSRQLVEITFVDIDIGGRDMGKCDLDYIEIYQEKFISKHLITSSLNAHIKDHNKLHDIKWRYDNNTVICGNLTDNRRTHFYSSKNVLVFIFFASNSPRQKSYRGFEGIFRFLSADTYKNKGVKLKDTACSYKYFSNNNTKSGYFYSPNYPQNYNPMSYCHYIFYAANDEQVYLKIEKATFETNNMSCIHVPDHLLLYDGLTDLDPLIAQICSDSQFPKEYRSSGSNLLMIFMSDFKNHYQGFMGYYAFQKIDFILETTLLTSMTCDKTISSIISQTGTISSPNYPKPYQPRMQCIYNFIGKGKERVQIKFLDFDLFHPLNDSNHCLDVDVLEIATKTNDQQSVIEEFCGNSVPPSIMSSGHTLNMDFRGFTSGDVRGFKFDYAFITNFGMKTGKQDKSYDCAFEFNSLEVNNGTFSSPNFPGLYPRDTECYYLFYGSPEEKVRIIFLYFNVEGIYPCIGNSESDYLELSNYRSVDRKFPRYCGGNKPTTIESDNNFFRITFKSNSLFDATGFEAHYQFFQPMENKIHYNYPNDAKITLPPHLLTLLLMLYALLSIP